ncbi:hypothetical protein MmazTMA_05400 [Methanosarcina mazei]|nr:hypothetical protein MmazTMA_05400 [Methanosarcina mazei]
MIIKQKVKNIYKIRDVLFKGKSAYNTQNASSQVHDLINKKKED